jgi:hypothetical protein
MRQSRGTPQALALGLWLATRGGLVAVGFGLTIVSAGVLAFEATRRGGWRDSVQLPMLAAYVMAWGAGITVAFGAALHALRRDAVDGVIALARARGIRAATYARARVAGLIAVLSLCVAGGTLAVGLTAFCAGYAPAATARATVGGVLYSLAFAATLGPVALATLGTRSRGGGYLLFLAVVVMPEVLSPWTSAALPRGWTEITSIPAALEAVGASVFAAHGALRLARALAMLAAVVGVSLTIVAAQIGRISSVVAQLPRSATRNA